MGSWNKTCGLTNLPIMDGDSAYVFILARVKDIHDHCYSTHLYKPLLFPFYSTYNDYGSGEDSSGIAFPIIMDAIKEKLVEMPVGKNPYHDIAVTRESWDEELFFDAVHEGRLKVSYGKEEDLNIVMMRKDVVDDLMETYSFQEYVGDGKGNSGSTNSYYTYKFQDIIAGIDQLFDSMLEVIKIKSWAWPNFEMVVSRCTDGFVEPNNVTASWLWTDLGYRGCNIVRPRDLVLENLIAGNRDSAHDILVEHLKGIFVNYMMEMTRKSWIPGGHEGSQRQDFEPYRALIASMEKAMKARDDEWAAEMGEDDE